MPSSRFSGLYLSTRTLAVLLVVVGVVGAMAFYRTLPSPARWEGSLQGTAAPIQDGAVQPLLAMNNALEHIAQHVAPAVVMVDVTSRANPRGGSEEGSDPFSQFFNQFGGGGQAQRQQPQPFEHGVGSGVILSPDGYIVTNNHVVEGATDIQIKLNDRRTLPAKIIGTDVLTDLAVVKIDATGLTSLGWGDSRGIKQGDTVFAFGNPFGIEFTMTRGIVSGLGRQTPEQQNNYAPGDFIQTDAAINPGNSGGPLVDVHGNVVGINAFIYTESGTFSGAGFAISSQVAEPTVRELIAHGKVVRGYMGIVIQPLDPSEAPFFNLKPDAEGALVAQVNPETPAAKAGLEVGDLITTFNGNKVTDSGELQILTGQTPPGTRAQVGIVRDGKPETLTVTLGTLPAEATQSPDEPDASSGNGNAGPNYGGRGRNRSRNATPPAATAGPLGIAPTDITPDARSALSLPESLKGALVQSVRPGSAAETAGLGRGDVITEVNRHPVANADELNKQLQAAGSGDVLLRIFRDNGSLYVVVRPESIGSGGGQR